LVLPRHIWDHIRSLGSENPPLPEIRGWRFDPVAPRYRYRPSPSEVASYCPTRRNIYLQKVLGRRPEPGPEARYGALVHEYFLEPFRLAARGEASLDNLIAARSKLSRRLGVRPDRFLLNVYSLGAGLALQAVYDSEIPLKVEPQLPGAPIGLSDYVRPDLLIGLLPVEVTSTGSRGTYGERKELQLAAYALAIEASTGLPVDYGVVLYLRRRDEAPVPEWRLVVIDDELRRAVLAARDEVAMIVEDGVDPGPAPAGCPEWCPFRGAVEDCPPRGG
jgi:CRISPR-associated protein Csa1